MEKAFSLLETKKPGDTLDSQEAKQLGKVVANLLTAVAQRRRNILLYHDSLQNTIGMFLQLSGHAVQYEVPFESGGERVIFDIVAQRGKEELVVEVKDEITSRDMGQVYGYADILQLAREKAKVYLGTDVLNYERVLLGMTGEMMKELMEREHLRLILADKYFLIICDNYNQLVLTEMPHLFFSEEKVG